MLQPLSVYCCFSRPAIVVFLSVIFADSVLTLEWCAFVSASRETAFIYAITSSGVVHKITKACARGVLRNCACNNTQLAEGTGFEWGGCDDNIEYGLKYASKFIDSREKEQDVRAKVNLHNNFVGRQVSIHRLNGMLFFFCRKNWVKLTCLNGIGCYL